MRYRKELDPVRDTIAVVVAVVVVVVVVFVRAANSRAGGARRQVLKNVTITIMDKEKVGIVGRTGSCPDEAASALLAASRPLNTYLADRRPELYEGLVKPENPA